MNDKTAHSAIKNSKRRSYNSPVVQKTFEPAATHIRYSTSKGLKAVTWHNDFSSV